MLGYQRNAHLSFSNGFVCGAQHAMFSYSSCFVIRTPFESRVRILHVRWSPHFWLAITRLFFAFCIMVSKSPSPTKIRSLKVMVVIP